MSKLTYNATLYYDTPEFSARVAWNYRSRYRTAVFSDYPEYSPYMDATSRLDAALNFTPVKFLTFSIEATNLLKNNAQMWWGKDCLLPYDIRLQARTIQTGVRFRFGSRWEAVRGEIRVQPPLFASVRRFTFQSTGV